MRVSQSVSVCVILYVPSHCICGTAFRTEKISNLEHLFWYSAAFSLFLLPIMPVISPTVFGLHCGISFYFFSFCHSFAWSNLLGIFFFLLYKTDAILNLASACLSVPCHSRNQKHILLSVVSFVYFFVKLKNLFCWNSVGCWLFFFRSAILTIRRKDTSSKQFIKKTWWN